MNLIIKIVLTVSLSTAVNVEIIGQSSKELKPMEIGNKTNTPIYGLDIRRAQYLIIESTMQSSNREALDLKIKELTTTEIWATSKFQIYRCTSNTLDNIAIIKDNKVVKNIKCFSIQNIFVADLDKDSKYEVYINNSFGSGLINDEVIGYNPFTTESYLLSDRGNKDFKILFVDGEFKISLKELEYFQRKGNALIAELIIDNNFYPNFLVKFNNLSKHS